MSKIKTKEFIKKVKSLNCVKDVEKVNDNSILVLNKNYKPIFQIWLTEEFCVDTNFEEFKNLEYEEKEKLFYVIFDYVRTEVEGREYVEGIDKELEDSWRLEEILIEALKIVKDIEKKEQEADVDEYCKDYFVTEFREMIEMFLIDYLYCDIYGEEMAIIGR